MMNWILDGGIVVLAVLLIWIGHRRGAIRSVIEFVGWIAALLAAALLGRPAADWVFATFLRGGLVTKFEQVISESVGASAADRVTAISDALPEYVRRFLNGESLATQIREAADAGAANGAQILVDQVVGPVLTMVLQAVVTVLLFVAVLLVFRLIARAGDWIARLPVLHQLNQALGAIFGAAKAALLILLAAAVLRASAPLIPADGALGADRIGQTVVLNWIYTHNPLYDFFAPSTAENAA